MSRITNKRENGFYDLAKGQEIWGEENGIRLVQIVGEYEDIRDDLGVDLRILVKALKNGIYASMYGGKPNNDINKIIFIEPRQFKLCLHVEKPCIYYEWGWPGPDSTSYYLSDYGKSWALAEGELKL